MKRTGVFEVTVYVGMEYDVPEKYEELGETQKYICDKAFGEDRDKLYDAVEREWLGGGAEIMFMHYE